MHVIFVEPSFPFNQRQFVRALHEVGAKVTGIGELPLSSMRDDVKSWLTHYEQVPSVVHQASLLEAVRRVQRLGWVDRLEATVEAHITSTAHVREACGIPGTSVRTAFLCRDKPAMKEALRAAGVPCAQSIGTDSVAEARDFVRQIGYPVIIKPRDAAGAAGTWRCANDQELEVAIRESRLDRGYSVAIEEFIEGHEGFFDTIAIGGRIAHHFVCHYFPNVLEAMRTRNVSPMFISTNRLEASSYDEVRALGKKVNEALGITTSATHMEWFFGPKGLKFSEIGCRPPGVGAWDLYCNSHDFDIYREWAMAIVHGRTSQNLSQRYAAGIVNLRPDRDGHLYAYEGLQLLDQLGDHIIDYHLPPVGSSTQPISGGYMANAWVRLKHPDYDQCKRLLEIVGQTVRLRAR